MQSPLKPFPHPVARWTRRARWLRWLDALAAWLTLWTAAALLLQGAGGAVPATFAALLAAAGTFVPSLRAWWRPISGSAALVVSRPLRPGDRAWHVSPGEAELVLVTARRGVRVVIASLARGPIEGVAVRRTHVLLIPADFSETE